MQRGRSYAQSEGVVMAAAGPSRAVVQQLSSSPSPALPLPSPLTRHLDLFILPGCMHTVSSPYTGGGTHSLQGMQLVAAYQTASLALEMYEPFLVGKSGVWEERPFSNPSAEESGVLEGESGSNSLKVSLMRRSCGSFLGPSS